MPREVVRKSAVVCVERGGGGGFVWFVRAPNGMELCRCASAGYDRRRDVERAIEAVAKCFRDAGIYQSYVDLTDGGAVKFLRG